MPRSTLKFECGVIAVDTKFVRDLLDDSEQVGGGAGNWSIRVTGPDYLQHPRQVVLAATIG
jgi:hypothetical protein